MRKFAFAGGLFGLLAVLVAVAGASLASAAPEWLCNGTSITGTGNNRCLTVAENLENFVLEDMAASSVTCESEAVLSTGWVGPGSEDETTEVKFTVAKCKPTTEGGLCQKVEGLSAVNLPWKTLIEEEKWDLVQNGAGAGKEPGYLVECKTALGNVDDTCTTKEPATDVLVELENLAAEGSEPKLVDVKFSATLLANSQAAKCSVGGTEQGLVVGIVLLAALTAAGALQSLEFNP